MKFLSILFVFVFAFLLSGCFLEDPDVVSARIRLIKSNTIVDIQVDTLIYSLGDTLTIYHNEFNSRWGISEVPHKDGQVKGSTTFYRGVIERWRKEKSKQAEVK